MKKLMLAALLVAAPLWSVDYFSVAGGVYDIMREKHRTGEFEMEYKFTVWWLPQPVDWLTFRPLIGVMSTFRRSGYGYLGINFDFTFIPHILISPGFAAGGYWKGHGKDLGYPIEFRTGIELAWVWSDARRLGVHYYHLSNASLGRRNPGEESFVFFFDIPINKGFPFSNK